GDIPRTAVLGVGVEGETGRGALLSFTQAVGGQGTIPSAQGRALCYERQAAENHRDQERPPGPAAVDRRAGGVQRRVEERWWHGVRRRQRRVRRQNTGARVLSGIP